MEQKKMKRKKKLQSKILAQKLKLYKKKEEWDQNLGSRENSSFCFASGMCGGGSVGSWNSGVDVIMRKRKAEKHTQEKTTK